MEQDTIVAIATPLTPSGIGIVRMSGDQAVLIADRVYQSKNKTKHLSECESHTIHYGFIMDGEECVDEVMVLLMKGPHSYTKEDSVEIDCHGGVVVMRRILELLIKNGARIAEPGEFTKRAFLNGRIDLSSAEAVIDLIDSKNEFARKSSLSQVQGAVYQEIQELREKILTQTAFIEAALDDPEHYSLDEYETTLRPVLKEVSEKIRSLIHSFQNGSILKEGIQTAIVGKPNAGKSSLLNFLSGKEKAIVTDIAGTTRDIIEEQIQLNGITLQMIDTAGIRQSEDLIEQIGVQKAKELLKTADLILYVVDSSVPLDENDFEIIELIQDQTAMVLLNKSDLEPVVTKEMLEEKTPHRVLSISAAKREGLDLLEAEISEMFFHGEVSFNDQVVITNLRQKGALEDSLESLCMVEEGLNQGMTEDFLSIDLMNAYTSLGEITGESVDEDLIDAIFEKFCMGK